MKLVRMMTFSAMMMVMTLPAMMMTVPAMMMITLLAMMMTVPAMMMTEGRKKDFQDTATSSPSGPMAAGLAQD